MCPCISLIRYHMQIYVLSLVQLPLLWWLKTQFFESKLVAEKISYFEMANFRLWTPLQFILIFPRLLIQINTLQKRQNTNGYVKEEPFLSRESLNYFPRTEKRNKVPICEMLESSGFFSSPMLPIFSWELKIIAYRGSFTIPSSSKLELLCQCVMTS